MTPGLAALMLVLFAAITAALVIGEMVLIFVRLKKNHWQVSLRTMLIVVTVLSLMFAGAAWVWREGLN